MTDSPTRTRATRTPANGLRPRRVWPALAMAAIVCALPVASAQPTGASPAANTGQLTQDDLTSRELDRLPKDDAASLAARIDVGLPPLPGPAGLVGADDLPELKGRVVVVLNWRRAAGMRQFGATIDQVAQTFGDDVVVLGLAQELDAERLGAMFSRSPAPGPIFADPQGKLAAQFGFGLRTTTVIADRNGVIRFVGVRAPAGLDRVLEMLVAEERDPAVRIRRTAADIAAEQDAAEEQAQALEEAWATRDGGAIDAALAELWTADRARALEISFGLLTSRDPFERPIGIDQLVRRATAEEALQAIEALPRGPRSIERRMLVRSLGTKLAESELEAIQAVEVLKPLVRDNDAGVQVSAVQALGDLGHAEGLEHLIGVMQASSPTVEEEFKGSDTDRVSAVAFGVSASITGLTSTQITTYRKWFETWQQGDPAALAEVEMELRERERDLVDGGDDPALDNENFNNTVIILGEDDPEWFETGPFWIRVLIYGVDEVSVSGRLGLDTLTRLGEKTLEQAKRRASAVYGQPYVPIIRLSFTDDNQFSSVAGNSFMGGEAQGNEIVVRIADDIAMVHFLTHVWEHIFQQILYEAIRLPRWLLEGYAESATRSDKSSVWTAEMISERELGRAFERGVFRTLASWGRGAASSPQESDNYALSHLAVDFLRFGNFPAAETRLAALHAAIDGRKPDRQALQEIYGMTLPELDRALVEWLNPED